MPRRKLRPMQQTTIVLQPWKWQGIVIRGGTPDDFAHWVKLVLGLTIDIHENNAARAFVQMGQPWVIWLRDFKNIPALAHEALHVAAGILDSRGLKFSDDSEEAYTYTMEDIIRQILRAKWRVVRW